MFLPFVYLFLKCIVLLHCLILFNFRCISSILCYLICNRFRVTYCFSVCVTGKSNLPRVYPLEPMHTGKVTLLTLPYIAVNFGWTNNIFRGPSLFVNQVQLLNWKRRNFGLYHLGLNQLLNYECIMLLSSFCVIYKIFTITVVSLNHFQYIWRIINY